MKLSIITTILSIFIIQNVSFAVTTRPPFTTIRIPAKKVVPNNNMIIAVIGEYIDDYQRLSNAEKDEVLKQTKIKVLNLGKMEVYSVEVLYPLFCGSSGGNSPSGLIVKTHNDKYSILINAGGNGIEYLKSKHNGMHDVVTYSHIGRQCDICSVYEYDGKKYNENKSRTVVQGRNNKGKRIYMSEKEFNTY